MSKPNLLIVLGATATGKTRLAVQLGAKLNGEIISADSRQVFKGMDLGTGKDLNEYNCNGIKIPHHLIDIKIAGDTYNVNEFKDDFYNAFNKISDLKKLPILCGGTGLYIHSILQNQPYTAIPVNENLRKRLLSNSKNALLDELNTYPNKYTLHVDTSSTKRLIRAIEIADYLKYHVLEIPTRPAINPIVIGLTIERSILRKRIYQRLTERIKNGLIEEVKLLLKNGVSGSQLTYYGLEYKFLVNYVKGEFSKEEMTEKLFIAICQFAKRQETFFRKMEKDGVFINWINAEKSTQCIFEEVFKSIIPQNFSR